jgi:hypothetical protein
MRNIEVVLLLLFEGRACRRPYKANPEASSEHVMARNPWQRHDQVPTLRFELVTLALHKWLQCLYEFQ